MLPWILTEQIICMLNSVNRIRSQDQFQVIFMTTLLEGAQIFNHMIANVETCLCLDSQLMTCMEQACADGLEVNASLTPDLHLHLHLHLHLQQHTLHQFVCCCRVLGL